MQISHFALSLLSLSTRTESADSTMESLHCTQCASRNDFFGNFCLLFNGESCPVKFRCTESLNCRLCGASESPNFSVQTFQCKKTTLFNDEANGKMVLRMELRMDCIRSCTERPNKKLVSKKEVHSEPRTERPNAVIRAHWFNCMGRERFGAMALGQQHKIKSIQIHTVNA